MITQRELLLRSLSFALPKEYSDIAKLDSIGILIYTGDQYNESWKWNDKYLNSLSESELYTLHDLILNQSPITKWPVDIEQMIAARNVFLMKERLRKEELRKNI